ncbi:hypothetical protein E2562_038780 [Oryza meyeriana var. granulata]|uniref:Uncharacterized protein n=1 Tax=Oryza meyeriana var. granulata TaxID=110450 RepID=A0A6G1FH09_9ORYZ|nr:hypothetical protein E2562_038780 [Oryza meyeriana var. granulata]
MAHDTKASGSSRLHDEETLRVQEPRAGGVVPKERPVPGEGNARSPLARKKMKTTATPEKRPFVGSPWGFIGPKPR